MEFYNYKNICLNERNLLCNCSKTEFGLLTIEKRNI